MILMYRSTEAYRQGREAYGSWYDTKGSTCIDGTEPRNPYQEGTQNHDDWNEGYYDQKNDCVLIDMGR